MMNPEDQVPTRLSQVFAKLDKLPDDEKIVVANKVNDALLEAQARVAAIRRAAVRQLRADGYTLREIGDLTGLAPQRISQIELGYGRKEKKARALEGLKRAAGVK